MEQWVDTHSRWQSIVAIYTSYAQLARAELIHLAGITVSAIRKIRGDDMECMWWVDKKGGYEIVSLGHVTIYFYKN